MQSVPAALKSLPDSVGLTLTVFLGLGLDWPLSPSYTRAPASGRTCITSHMWGSPPPPPGVQPACVAHLLPECPSFSLAGKPVLIPGLSSSWSCPENDLSQNLTSHLVSFRAALLPKSLLRQGSHGLVYLHSPSLPASFCRSGTLWLSLSP